MVARSLPNTALTSVKRSPVSCMPSPESPANRMTTSSRFSGSSDLVAGVAVTRPSPRCVGSGGKWWCFRVYRGRAPVPGCGHATRPGVRPGSLQHLPRPERLPERGVDPATITGPTDQLGLDVDPRAHAARPLVEAPTQAADHHEDLPRPP